jgi:serine/threonine-protein kinase
MSDGRPAHADTTRAFEPAGRSPTARRRRRLHRALVACAGVFLGLAGVLVFVRIGLFGTAIAFAVATIPAALVTLRFHRRRRGPKIGRQLGPYEIGPKLGEGGMGTVYEARHGVLGRRAALKVVKASRFDAEAMARFEREARVTGALCHPNCVTLFDYGEGAGGVHYLAMELVSGPTLEEVLATEGALSPRRVLGILRQVAGALAHAHAKHLVHRDIKPSNVMLCRRDGYVDFVKVLDFGLAKSLVDECEISHAKIVGTPLFMSPEASSSAHAAGPPADIYAVGTLGYALLTGVCLFEDRSIASLARAHRTEPPLPPSLRSEHRVPRDLEDVIMRCLAKDPGERFADGSSLLAALEACAEPGEAPARRRAVPRDVDATRRRASSVETRVSTPRAPSKKREASGAQANEAVGTR